MEEGGNTTHASPRWTDARSTREMAAYMTNPVQRGLALLIADLEDRVEALETRAVFLGRD